MGDEQGLDAHSPDAPSPIYHSLGLANMAWMLIQHPSPGPCSPFTPPPPGLGCSVTASECLWHVTHRR